MTKFHCVSVLPEMFAAVSEHGITGRALKQGLATLKVWNPRDFTQDNYHRVDDRPYGGGPGMVMLAEPLDKTLQAIKHLEPNTTLLSMSPHGRKLDQSLVHELQAKSSITILCGRYEGIDQRLLDKYPMQEVSVGDFVVSGGELPAMLLMDALIRFIPGAMNDSDSAEQDSFMNGLLDFPHYTRPETWQEQGVPSVLLKGNHAHIQAWRREQALTLTAQKRPDLLRKAVADKRLSRDDLTVLKRQGFKLD